MKKRDFGSLLQCLGRAPGHSTPRLSACWIEEIDSYVRQATGIRSGMVHQTTWPPLMQRECGRACDCFCRWVALRLPSLLLVSSMPLPLSNVVCFRYLAASATPLLSRTASAGAAWSVSMVPPLRRSNPPSSATRCWNRCSFWASPALIWSTFASAFAAEVTPARSTVWARSRCRRRFLLLLLWWCWWLWCVPLSWATLIINCSGKGNHFPPLQLGSHIRFPFPRCVIFCSHPPSDCQVLGCLLPKVYVCTWEHEWMCILK